MLRIRNSKPILLIAIPILVVSFCLFYFQKTKQNHLNIITIPHEQLNNIRLTEFTIIASKNELFFKTIKVGNIITSDIHPNTPQGLLRKVIRIKESSDSLFFDTKPIALSTVIQAGSIKVSGQLNPKNIQN